MINISTSAKLRYRENQKTLFKADFILDTTRDQNKGKTSTYSLTGDDVMQGSVTFNDSVTSSGNFDVGSAIINSLSITLNNFDDRFSLIDFTNAQMRVYLGIPLVDNVTDQTDSSQVEWINRGFYTVDKPTNIGNTIPLTMLDNMSRFEFEFSKVSGIGFPITVGNLITKLCTACSVILDVNVPYPSWKINTKPTDENLTCLNLINYIAQIEGCYAKINREGHLVFGWYDGSAFNPSGTESNLDGGTFFTSTTPYSDGSNADGGDYTKVFETYVDEEGVTRQRYKNPSTKYDGGAFDWGNYGVIQSFSNFSIGTDTIKITGIKVVIDNPDSSSEQNQLTYLVDKNGQISSSETSRRAKAEEYMLEFTGNKLMPYLDNLGTCLNYLGSKIVGMVIRPFNVSALSDIQLEVGDAVRVFTPKGDFYDTYLSTLSFPLNGYETFSLEAQSVSEKKVPSTNLLSTAIADTRNEMDRKISSYDLAVERMQKLLSGSLGFYETKEKQTDGSYIYYMHNAPTLNASTVAYKQTIDAFAWMKREKTTDNWTVTSGVSQDGSAVVSLLTAVGVNADWITTGTINLGGGLSDDTTLEVKNGSGQVVIRFDKDGMTFDNNYKIDFANITGTNNLATKNDLNGLAKDSDLNGFYKGTQTLYYAYKQSKGGSKPSAPSKPTYQITSTSDSYNMWTTVVPTVDMSKTYSDGSFAYYTNDTYMWTCVQYTTKSGNSVSYAWSDPVEFENSSVSTVITSNTITTDYLNAKNITAKNISATTLDGKTLNIGGSGDNGKIHIIGVDDKEWGLIDRYYFNMKNDNFTTNYTPSGVSTYYIGDGSWGTVFEQSYKSNSSGNVWGYNKYCSRNGSEVYDIKISPYAGISYVRRYNGYIKESMYLRINDYYSRSELDVDFIEATTLTVSGTKSRVASTDNYDNRLLYCYETPTPYFGDIGEGVLDDTGTCYVDIDMIFAETIDNLMQYQVFLQKYGQGDCWIEERNPDYFIVKGTPNLKFGWELKCPQREYSYERLGIFEKIEHETESEVEE